MAGGALLTQGLSPVDTHEVIEAVAALLTASDPLTEHLGAGDGAVGVTRLYTHEVPLHRADGTEGSAAPLWLLAREMQTPLGASERPSGLAVVWIQILVNLAPGRTRAPVEVIAETHQLAWEALEAQALDGTAFGSTWTTRARLTRVSRPSPARLDARSEDTGARLFSSALYQIAVAP